MEEKEFYNENSGFGDNGADTLVKVTGMYKDWFLDYASYVILERAVPAISDGLKPVQRRILHSMKDLDDGRYNKVANIVGHTMQYHPHGDASIADAMVQIGQKDLMIDMQGNWGEYSDWRSCSGFEGTLKLAYQNLQMRWFLVQKLPIGSFPTMEEKRNL
jgi:topoisomerase-4 subunit A